MKWIVKKCMVCIFLIVICILSQDSIIVSSATQTDELGVNTYSTNGLSIECKVGYDNILRLGRETSFYVTITALESNFTGKILISVPDAMGNTVSYEHKATVHYGESEEFEFPILVINKWSNYSLEIINSRNTSIFYKEIDIEVKTDMEKVYIGLLSNDMEELAYINAKDAVVNEINLELCHGTINDWKCFDVIVIDQFDLDELSDECFTNLVTWVDRGGTLVLGTGNGYRETMPRFIEAGLLSVEFGPINRMKTCLGREHDIQYNYSDYNTADPKRLDNASLELPVLMFSVDNSRVLRKEEVPFVEAVDYGDGNVVLFHIALGERKFFENAIGADISDLVTSNISSQREELLYFSPYAGNVDAIRLSVLKDSDNIDIPSIIPYVILIIVYLLVIGPGLYAILKKTNHLKLLWYTFPVVTVLFSIIVYIAGGNSRNMELKSSYFSMLFYDEDVVNEETIFQLTVPYNGTFRMYYHNQIDLNAINDKRYDYYADSMQTIEVDTRGNYQRRISEGNPYNQIHLKSMTPFSAAYFEASNQYTVNARYESEINVSEDGYSGNFINYLGVSLKHAFFVSSGSVVYLGDIDHGTNVSLVTGEGIALQSCNYDTIADYVESKLQEQSDEDNMIFEMSNAINYVVTNFFKGDRTKSLIIGFGKSGYVDGVADQLKVQSDSAGLEMHILPVEIHNVVGNKNFVIDLGNLYEVMEGSYILGDDYRIFSGTLVLEYQLPTDIRVDALCYTEFFNSPYNEETFNGFAGKVYLFNLETHEYDEVFEQYGDYIEDVSNYITEENTVIVKYRVSSEYQDYYMTVPYISYYKEGN